MDQIAWSRIPRNTLTLRGTDVYESGSKGEGKPLALAFLDSRETKPDLTKLKELDAVRRAAEISEVCCLVLGGNSSETFGLLLAPTITASETKLRWMGNAISSLPSLERGVDRIPSPAGPPKGLKSVEDEIVECEFRRTGTFKFLTPEVELPDDVCEKRVVIVI
jgi:hypothetical protein